MQYIQLQGQVAEELDLPINGAYNLFIDTSDNSIKAKDSDGVLTGGGNSLTEVTKTQLDGHIASGSLTPGTFYKITGTSSGSNARYIQEGGTTVILQAATTSSLNPRGVGLFWNPKYYNPNTDLGEYEVWHDTFAFITDRYITGEFFDMEETINLDAPSNIILRPNILDNTMLARVDLSTSASYFLDSENYPISFSSSNTTITGSLTGFNNAPPPFTSGSKVIWGGRVWGNLNGQLGSHDGQWTIAGPEWEVLPYNSTDYNLVADIIEYDYQNDMICYRKDVVHNVEVTSTFEWIDSDGNYNGIRQVPWGHPQIYNVSLENTDTADFVNFDNSNRIHGLHMKRGSRFEANYWGKNNYFNDIFGDADSDLTNLSLGRYATISNIRLGINSTIGGGSSLYIVGNDGSTLTDITMGTNCDIYGMNMYQYSQIDEITMDTNASIYTMNMYDESYIRDLDMSMNSSLHDISMGNNSDMYNITLDADSYIANVNLDTSAQIYNTTLGRSSYIDYSSIGINCSMYDISLGLDSYINCINLYNSSNLSSNINSITLGDNSNLINVGLYGGTSITDINTSNNCGIDNLTITGSNSYISDFQLEQNSGFGGFTINGSAGSVGFDNFKIGQNNGFGGGTYIANMSDVTIERAFNNFEVNNLIAGVTASFSSGFGWSDAVALNSLDTNKSFQILDTTGWDASESTLNYYLAGGDFDGQTIKFFMTSDGSSIAGNAGNLRIWLNTFSTMDNFSSIQTQQPWYPFSQNTNYGAVRVDIPQCIWMSGRWIIDNDSWD